MHAVTKDYIKKIKEALKEFGRYSYYDKGAYEVMEVTARPIYDLPQAERIQVIKELYAYEHGQNFLMALEDDFEEPASDSGMTDEEAEEIYALIENEGEEENTPTPIEFGMGCVRDTLGK